MVYLWNKAKPPVSTVEHEETTSQASVVDTFSRGNSYEPSRFPLQKRLTNSRLYHFVPLSTLARISVSFNSARISESST